jgi:signal transduction histidine kinase
MSSSRTTTRRSDGGTVSHVSWLRRLPSYGDVVVAAVLSVLVQVNVWDVHFAHRLQFSLLALIMAGALLAVRWWPVPACLVALAMPVTMAGIDAKGTDKVWTMLFAIVFVSWSAGHRLPLRGAIAFQVLALGGLAFVAARLKGSFAGNFVWSAIFITAFWIAGIALHRRVAREEVLTARALRLELEQELAADRAVAAERQRIARELHDVIAHSVSVMTVQAGAVRRLLLPEQEKEREALVSVEATGRQALTEMRRLVGLLKEDTVMPMYAPQPSMKTLDVLVGTVREAGLPVELSVEGERRELAPGVDLAAYRVVQEALTNALKYAGPARAWVAVRWAPDQLELQVENDGRTDGNGQSDGGHGLVGMRERIAVVGGTLESGPRTGGGFVVRARIPLGGTS